MSLDKITRINIKEFVESGYLAEANRRFFHPLGLAMEYYVNPDGSFHLGGIWDYRSDPEGMCFYEPDQDKAAKVEEEWEKRSKIREKRFGWTVQPPDYKVERPPETETPLLKEFPVLLTNESDLDEDELFNLQLLKEDENEFFSSYNLWREADGRVTMAFSGKIFDLTNGVYEVGEPGW